MQSFHSSIYKEIGRDDSSHFQLPPFHNQNPPQFPYIQKHRKTSKPSIKPVSYNTMEPSQNNREIGWSDSSDSEAWIDDEEMGVHNAHEHNSIRRRGPVIQLDRESLEHNRVFWRQCIVGYLLDRRWFSIRRMQSILAAA